MPPRRPNAPRLAVPIKDHGGSRSGRARDYLDPDTVDRTLAPYHPDDFCVIEDQERLLTKTHVWTDDDEISTTAFDQPFLSRPSLHRHHGIRDLSERLLKPLEQHRRMAIVFGQAVLILDATASLPLIEQATGRKFKTIEVRVPENLDVTVVDTSGSKLAINGGALRDAPTDDEMAASIMVRDGVIRAFDSFAAGRECPVITHLATEELWRDELPEHLPLLHFGNLVGRNDVEHCDRLIVLGRQQPHESQLILLAAAMAESQGRDITTIDDWLDRNPEHRDQRRFDGYLNRLNDDGSFDERFAWHPDPIVEAMRWRACEGELIQAVGRLRSTRSETPKMLLLITNIIVPGIVPNRVIPYRELKRGKCHRTAIEEYTHRLSNNGGVVPLGALDMVRLEPELFKTQDVARQSIRQIKCESPLYRLYMGDSHLITAAYRKRGQRGKSCKALVRNGHTTASARRELERMVGPLSDFSIITEATTTGPKVHRSSGGCGWSERPRRGEEHVA